MGYNDAKGATSEDLSHTGQDAHRINICHEYLLQSKNRTAAQY